jgi:hypothetical protein
MSTIKTGRGRVRGGVKPAKAQNVHSQDIDADKTKSCETQKDACTFNYLVNLSAIILLP